MENLGRRVGIAGALLLGVGLLLVAHPTIPVPTFGTAKPTVASDLCRAHYTDLASVYRSAIQGGQLKATGSDTFGSTFEVDEATWRGMTHDGKVAFTLSAYCQVENNGRATVVLTGLHDGQNKASIVDGNYSD